jgi:hypothetical protein
MATLNAVKITQLKALYPVNTLIGQAALFSGVPSSLTASVSTWLTYEISSYQGAGGRKNATTPADAAYVAGTSYYGAAAECPISVIFDNTTGSAAIEFTHCAIITSAPEIIAVAHNGTSTKTIPIGESLQINIYLRIN